MILMFTRIVSHKVQASSKDSRRRVLRVVAAFMGLDGEHRRVFEFPPRTRPKTAYSQVPRTLNIIPGV